MLRLLLITACLLVPSARGADGPAVSLLSFNIRYGTADDGPDHWDRRREMVMEVFERHAPDVVGLQEALAFQIAEIRERLPRYAAVGVGRDDGLTGGEHCTILYRADRFTLAESGTFWLSDTPDAVASATWGNSITRICTWARLIDDASGRAFYVFNTHFDHVSQPSRERSVRLIAERVAARAHPDPLIVMGDFNIGETNPAMAFLLRDPDGPGWVDTFRVVHPDETEVGTFNAFRDRTDGDKIDFILAAPGVRVLEASIDRARVDGRSPSDHEPVTARIELPARPGAAPAE
jgi:endonuclease/exonuclease/phosphatase family metal-dependent hydrolase